MAARIRRHDWSSTPLGPAHAWPEALKAAVRIILRTPVPMALLWGASGIMVFNDGYAAVAADRHPQLLGKNVREAWPEIADFDDNVMKVCLRGEALSYRDQPLTLYRYGKARQAWMNLDYSPVLDEKGQPVGVMAIVVETTDRVMADRRNAAEHDRLQRMFEQAPSFMAILRGKGHVFEMVNPGYVQLVGNRDVVGKSVAEALPEVATQGFIDMLDKAFTSGEAVTGRALPVLLRRHKDRGPDQRYVDLVYQPIRDENDTVTHIFVQGSDVTERVLAERQQQLLMNELAHRVRNTLATVRAIATRTLRGAATLDEAEVNLNARILALSRAQDILTGGRSEGAEIGSVITSAVRAHNDDHRRFRIDGPEFKLNAGAALALSLALHELSTNASKYGALSDDAGLVSIDWAIERHAAEPSLQVRWVETGGPAVSAPTRRGFGSTLIEEAVAAETGGTAVLDFRPEGVVFTLHAPLEEIEEG